MPIKGMNNIEYLKELVSVSFNFSINTSYFFQYFTTS